MLEGLFCVAYPPEISSSKTVVPGPQPSPMEHANKVQSSFSSGSLLIFFMSGTSDASELSFWTQREKGQFYSGGAGGGGWRGIAPAE